MLRLTLFGGFSLAGADGAEILLKSRKAKALLAYLALPLGKTRSREEIMALLWSDRGETQARASLRQVLTGLRKDLGEEAMVALQISDDALSLDTDQITVENGDDGEELLAGFNLHDPAFEEWLRDERLRTENEMTAGGQSAPLTLPDKPSIAVLPFVNMSGDAEQEYFSDGITEDIITELSRFRDLFIIARNSSYSYKGKAVKVQVVAMDLGVQYVLEGSVQAAGGRVRITAELVDADTGHHIWAERYNRKLVDIFALQDEISQTVASAAAGRLKLTAEDRAARKPISNLQAYDYVLRGQAIIGGSEENNLRARSAYKKAIVLDPNCVRAYLGLASCHIWDLIGGWGDSGQHSLNEALNFATKAVSLDSTDSSAQGRLGRVLAFRGEFEEAKIHLERALELNPNDADSLAFMGSLQSQLGKHNEAIESHRRAMRLNPYHSGLHLWLLGIAYYNAKRYAEALIPVKEYTGRNPKVVHARLLLAATYAQLGRVEESRSLAEEILGDQPDFSLRQQRLSITQQYKYSHDLEHWLEGLRKAGFPE